MQKLRNLVNKISSNFSPRGSRVGRPNFLDEAVNTWNRIGSIPNPLSLSVNAMPSSATSTTSYCRRTGSLHRRPELPPQASSSEEWLGRWVPGVAPSASPSAARLQAPARRPRPLDGGLGSGRSRASSPLEARPRRGDESVPRRGCWVPARRASSPAPSGPAEEASTWAPMRAWRRRRCRAVRPPFGALRDALEESPGRRVPGVAPFASPSAAGLSAGAASATARWRQR
jgi:hypothetical protein